MAKILITGGAGFVGRNLIHSLRFDHQICVVDDFSAHSHSLDDLGISVENVSITNKKEVTQIFEKYKPEVVFHLAALHYIPYCLDHPKETFEVNIYGTQVITHLCNQFQVEHFIIASSAAVYGAQTGKRSETDPSQPICIYGQSKHLCEKTVSSFSQVPWTMMRFFNIYGPYETTQHLIVTILDQLKNGDTLQLGNLDSVRDYIHVFDVISALKASMLNPKSYDQIFNVGTSIPTSGYDLIACFQEVLKKKLIITQDSRRLRKSDIPFLCSHISKISKVLDWRPKILLSDGLKERVASNV
jgi:UDP-glucose 4-epimerase